MATDKVKLSGRQQAFVEAYIADIKHNQTAAAIAAGYKEKTAAQAASRLMKEEKVAAAIAARIEELHRERTAEANEVVEFLTSVMRGDKVDNIPLFVGDGEQKLKEGKPTARDRLKAAEMLGKYYAIFDGKSNNIPDSGGIVILPEVQEAATGE